MPIRINLLAEAHAADEARRKDPVKGAVLVGVIMAGAVLVWASSLQIKIVAAKSRMNGLQTHWKSIEKTFRAVEETQRQALEAQAKMDALVQLNTNRFLWGSALNAFQQTLNGVDDIQVVRLKAEQSYLITEEIKTKKGVVGKPATATEKATMTIEALDSSHQPGRDQVAKFKDSIAQVPWFAAKLQKTNSVLLTSLSAPQGGVGRKPFVMFTLQCFFPEKTR